MQATGLRTPVSDATLMPSISTICRTTSLCLTHGAMLLRHVQYLSEVQPWSSDQTFFDFMTAFRNESANDRYMWIDQVCIDQSNMDERNDQVRLMSIIYERAAFVVVWLDKTSHLRPEEAPQLTKHDFHRRILANRYFRRLWIVQEILLSSHICVLCGNTWVPWDALADAVLS
jgi:hypothetical protein